MMKFFQIKFDALNVDLEEVNKSKDEVSKKLEKWMSDHSIVLTEHEKAKSRIDVLEQELRESKKCNDVLITKFMKSENDYLKILKDLDCANSKVLKSE